jgi:hypothetical protein
MYDDDRLRALASTQHGLVAKRQAADLGFSPDAIRHRLARGEWSLVTPRVLRVTGSPALDAQRLMTALLHTGPDAHLSHPTALACWGVPGFPLFPVHVIRCRAGRTQRVRDWFVHTTTDLGDQHITVLDGMPITTPIRSVFDIAARAHPNRVERALDTCWNRGLITYALLHRTVDELGGRGRPGSSLFRELAATRPASFRPPESRTEARLNELLVRDGQKPLVRQLDIGDDEHWLVRLDLTAPEVLLLVDVQSQLFHGSVLDRRLDAERLERLRTAGWQTLEIWESAVWERPREAVDAVRRARSAAATYRATAPRSQRVA